MAEQPMDQATNSVLGRLSIAPTSIQYVTPQLLTFLRSLGYDASKMESDLTRAKAGVDADEGYAKSKLDVIDRKERRGIAGDVLRRGVAGGGEATRALAEQGETSGFRRTDLQRELAGRRAGVQDAYDTGISSLRRGALERILESDTGEATRRSTEAAETARANALAEAQRGYNDTLIAQQGTMQQMYQQMYDQMVAAARGTAGGASPGPAPTITRMGSGPVGSGNETMAGVLPEYNIANFRLEDYLTPKPTMPTKPKTATRPQGYTYGSPLLQQGRY